MWGPDSVLKSNDIEESLAFPRPQTIRNSSHGDENPPTENDIDDIAFADLGDEVEFLTHSSGDFGSFTKKDRLNMIRLSLAEIEKHNSSVVIFQNMACIYKYTHLDRLDHAEKTNIGVGIVEKVHVCPETGQELVDIRFCPPKGAKPATKNRQDTLYQPISVDYAYNLSYKSAKGKKVEKEDINLPRSVMLAFNLEINKSDGRFSKRRRNDSPYNMSSYSLAQNVIENFYSSGQLN